MKLTLFALDRYLALFPGEKRRETREGDDGHVLKSTVLLACGPIWFTTGSLESRLCYKWRDLTASYP